MIAILLCAGFATRMYPMTRDFPKPLLPVADRPVLDYLMDQIVELQGLREVHLVSNARFFKHFEQWRSGWQTVLESKNIQIDLHNNGIICSEDRLGAVRDLHLTINSLPTPSKALVSAGDNIYRFRLRPLWQQFLTHKEHFIIGLPEDDEARLKKTGVLMLAHDNRVVRLHEKPRRPPSTWSCPPLYFFHESAWRILDEYIQDSDQYDAPGSFIDYLCQNEEVNAFKPAAGRLDIGSIKTYQAADKLLRKESIMIGPEDKAFDPQKKINPER